MEAPHFYVFVRPLVSENLQISFLCRPDLNSVFRCSRRLCENNRDCDHHLHLAKLVRLRTGRRSQVVKPGYPGCSCDFSEGWESEWDGVGWGSGGGGEETKPQKDIKKQPFSRQLRVSQFPIFCFCFGGRFSKCIFAEGRWTGNPQLLGEIRGPIWRSKDHLVMK